MRALSRLRIPGPEACRPYSSSRLGHTFGSRPGAVRLRSPDSNHATDSTAARMWRAAISRLLGEANSGNDFGGKNGQEYVEATRMTYEEAVLVATKYVKERYAVEPPVASVQHGIIVYHEGAIVYKGTTWFQMPGSSAWRKSTSYVPIESKEKTRFSLGHADWFIVFFMSWNTDAAGAPPTLMVVVDDGTGAVREVIPSRLC